MGTSNYSDEFKRDAVQQITVRGYPVREVSPTSKPMKDGCIWRSRSICSRAVSSTGSDMR